MKEDRIQMRINPELKQQVRVKSKNQITKYITKLIEQDLK